MKYMNGESNASPLLSVILKPRVQFCSNAIVVHGLVIVVWLRKWLFGSISITVRLRLDAVELYEVILICLANVYCWLKL